MNVIRLFIRYTDVVCVVTFLSNKSAASTISSCDVYEIMCSAPACTSGTLRPYDPPPWTAALKYRPTTYVELVMRPTPIHRWNLPGVPSGFQVYVKRDDLTGNTLSGNKVRKLEFYFAEALEKGCDSVITCGGLQSNHARTTSMAARQLGLTPHIMLQCPPDMDVEAVSCHGNLLLDRLAGSHIKLIQMSGTSYFEAMTKITCKMKKYQEELKAEGSSAYIIPVRECNVLGVWGYIEAFREMMEQGFLDSIDDIVTTICSGDTIAGLAITKHLTGSKIKFHGVTVCDDADTFYKFIDEELEFMGLTEGEGGEPLRARDLVDIIEGYVGLGYGQSTEEELAQMVDIVSSTGVPVDPVYTLKGVRGMLAEMGKNPERFAGKRVLFIHTGGIFGLYDGKIDSVLKKNPTTNRVSIYKDSN